MHDLTFSPLAPEDTAALVDRCAPLLDDLVLRPEAPVLAASPSFYPGCRLLAVPVAAVMPEAAEAADGMEAREDAEVLEALQATPRVVHLLLGPDGMEGEATLLDWTNAPIYAFNERLPIRLEPATLPSYVKFFFHFVRGQLGAFNIVERPEDITWLPQATQADKDAVHERLIPLTFHGLDEDNFYRFTATVLFKDALFRTDIVVAPMPMELYNEELGAPEPFTLGQLALRDEDVLLEDLPVPPDFHPDLHQLPSPPAL
ncbi:hypothetical protein [Megalodesulfovibrio paquesii]